MQAELRVTRRVADRLARIRKLPLPQRTVVSLPCLPRTVAVNEKRPRQVTLLWHLCVNRTVRPITVSRPPGPDSRPVGGGGGGALTVTVAGDELDPPKLASPL